MSNESPPEHKDDEIELLPAPSEEELERESYEREIAALLKHGGGEENLNDGQKEFLKDLRERLKRYVKETK